MTPIEQSIQRAYPQNADWQKLAVQTLAKYTCKEWFQSEGLRDSEILHDLAGASIIASKRIPVYSGTQFAGHSIWFAWVADLDYSKF